MENRKEIKKLIKMLTHSIKSLLGEENGNLFLLVKSSINKQKSIPVGIYDYTYT